MCEESPLNTGAMETNGTETDDFCNHILFTHIAGILNKISGQPKNETKKEILRKFICKFKEQRLKFLAEGGTNAVASFYPILRLLIPKCDKERESYGIRTKRLGELLIKVLGINKSSDDAKKLTFEQKTDGNSGNFGDVVYEVMKNRSAEKGTLTIVQVNEYLDLIGNHFKNNQGKHIEVELFRMMQRMTELDWKWLTKIILKKLNLGLGPTNILQLYDLNAETVLKQCGHLSRACEIIENNEPIDVASTVAPCQLIWPMLCEKIKLSRLSDLINANEFALETKLDGERCQIHMNGAEFRYYSRNGNDFTSSYVNTYTPVLAQLLNQKSIQNIILDGEMMVWNRSDESFHMRAEFINARGLRPDDKNLNPCFCVYDILYVNGEPLLDKPYAERVRKLRSTINEKHGLLKICNQTTVVDSEHILECLNKAFDDNEEGVVIKKRGSVYQPGKRDGGGWYKIKPDYGDGICSDLDLVIIGGFYNERKTFITRYLAAVCETHEKNPEKSVFHGVCRIYSGLSYAQWQEIDNKLKSHWNPVGGGKKGCSSPYIDWHNYPPDVWIEPKHSLILQVRAAGITKTSRFRTGCTLQFPRVEKIRDDKMWYDCCTLNEFQELSSAKSGKIVKRHVIENDITEPKSKRRRLPKTTTAPIITKVVKLVDNIAEGKEFCIFNSTQPTVEDLEDMVRKHGGETVKSPSDKTFVCIAATKSFRVLSYMDEGKGNKKKETYDIAKVEWLLKAMQSDTPLDRLLPLHPSDMLHITDKLQQQFDQEFDPYGDSYTKPVDEAELGRLLDSMDFEKLPPVTDDELDAMELELTGRPLNYFRKLKGYFYSSTMSDSPILDVAKLLFKYKGGQCVDYNQNVFDNSCLTHIFAVRNDLKQCKLNFVGMVDGKREKPIILDLQWIRDCIAEKRLISERNYTWAADQK